MRNKDVFKQAEEIGKDLDNEFYDLIEAIYSEVDAKGEAIGNFKTINEKRRDLKLKHKDKKTDAA